MSKRPSGFTFIELLVAMLIFSIVAISIYLSFNVGIHAWRKGEDGYKTRQGMRYLLSSISRELRNAVNSKEIAFSGGADGVSFCKAANGLFKVSYEFDSSKNEIYKVVWTYKENFSAQPGTRSRLASGISDFKLQYSYTKDEKIEWSDTWEEANIVPIAVKVSLTYNPGGEAQPVAISETVWIPTGVLKEKEAE